MFAILCRPHFSFYLKILETIFSKNKQSALCKQEWLCELNVICLRKGLHMSVYVIIEEGVYFFVFIFLFTRNIYFIYPSWSLKSEVSFAYSIFFSLEFFFFFGFQCISSFIPTTVVEILFVLDLCLVLLSESSFVQLTRFLLIYILCFIYLFRNSLANSSLSKWLQSLFTLITKWNWLILPAF